ncbi:hypothetical protein F4802DRAFT_82084 [Xylaria palmicola]|nr:hypothetical protein F4802DRAFT_82084 [Xylaria palmicola]
MLPANLPFTVGNDICRIARVRRILAGRLGPQFVRRILRTEEIQHPPTSRVLRCILDKGVQSGAEEAGSVPARDDATSFTRAVEFMAGRFAAKEAVIKAHPHRRLTFQRIAILRTAADGPPASAAGRERGAARGEPDGAPQSGPLVALVRAEGAFTDTYASVSVSHDTEYATAVCLGFNPGWEWKPGAVGGTR